MRSMERGWCVRFVAGLGTLMACASLSGCLVMGYSSGGGFWIWSGSLVVTVTLVLLYLLSRR
jgi:hypothetical protein